MFLEVLTAHVILSCIFSLFDARTWQNLFWLIFFFSEMMIKRALEKKPEESTEVNRPEVRIQRIPAGYRQRCESLNRHSPLLENSSRRVC